MALSFRAIFQLFDELYRYREVLVSMISRDLKLKYKRTYFGYLWSLLNPLLQLAVMGTIFSHLVRLPIHDYTVFLFSGLIAWGFFQSSLLVASLTFLQNENFLKKIYIPKILFPLSCICLRSIDFLLSLLALTVIGVVAGFSLKATFALVPAAVVLLFLFTFGWAIIAAVVTVYFHDIQYLLGVLLQLMYFATPILYPLSTLPEKYQAVLQLNPLYSQVLIFQRLIYEGVVPTSAEWSAALSTALGSLLLGLVVLLWTEDELVFQL